jgi:hypothetical protein
MNVTDEIIEELVYAAFSVLSHDTDPSDTAHQYGERMLREKFKAILKR